LKDSQINTIIHKNKGRDTNTTTRVKKIMSQNRFKESYLFADKDYRNTERNCAPNLTVIHSDELDQKVNFAPKEIQAAAAVISATMLDFGFDLNALLSEVSIPHEAMLRLSQIQQSAQLLYSEWQINRKSNNRNGELAVARLFNSMTARARKIHNNLQEKSPFDQSHITDLANDISRELRFTLEHGGTNLEAIAQAANIAGDRRTNNLAWPWTVLPTFPKQSYGRILLSKVPGFHPDFPCFITQTTFLAGEITQFHTHGQNIAFARPLGNSAKRENAHINTTWKTASKEQVFPLVQTDRQFYTSGNVAIIPPLAIHAISGSRKAESSEFIPINQLRDASPEDVSEYAKKILFGETSCLHIYLPDIQSMQIAEGSPFVTDNPKFFIENDMIVFDHQANLIWTGGGGAWAKRMLTYGANGEHCGACYTENDPRLENISGQTVLDWHLDHEANKPIIMSF